MSSTPEDYKHAHTLAVRQIVTMRAEIRELEDRIRRARRCEWDDLNELFAILDGKKK